MIVSLIGTYIDKSEYDRGDISEVMGVTRNTVTNWCKGHSYPSIPQLFKLGDLLGVHYGDFYIRKEDN